MIYRFTFFLALLSTLAQAQPGNLVENPSFEFRPECDDNNGPVEEAPPWFNPTGATPDVFHECAVQLEDPCPYPENVFLDPWLFGVPTNVLGCQEPRTGLGYAGMYFMTATESPDFEYREYLAIPLTATMNLGETYLIRFFVSLAERSLYGVHAIQVAFRPDSISQPASTSFLNIEPQLSNEEGNFILDRENWVELSWEYTADGTEQYMYIGNFQSNSVVETVVAVPDSIDQEDHFWSYYYIDDVYVGTDLLSTNDQINRFDCNIWPNPAQNYLSIESDKWIKSVEIFSIQGKLMDQKIQDWTGEVEFNLNRLESGSYFLVLTDQNGFRATKQFIKR